MKWTHRSLGTLGVAGALALVPLAGSADVLDQPFLITTSTQTATGLVTHRTVMVVHADGSGDAASAARDRSCYAVVQRVLAAGSARTPYAIGVVLDDDLVVTVPMTVSLAQPGAGARLIDAIGEGVVDYQTPSAHLPVTVQVQARVLAQDGRLEAATFQETAYLVSPSQTVEVSGCAVQRLPTTAPVSV